MMMRSLLAVCLLGLTPVACSPAPSPNPQGNASDAAPSAAPSEVARAPASAEPAAVHSEPVACGALGCMQYGSAAEAFKALLKNEPLIVAVGEAHAQKGTEHIPTATARFTKDLLPLLTEGASDLVLELMIPDPGCKKETAKVETNVEKPVTQSQASSNKTEFQTMAEKAKAMGVRPHVLRPTCEHLKRVADAGDEGVLKMLSLIAYLSDDIARRILARNAKTSVTKGLVLYGGAMHNDLTPAAGREEFSFGPELSKHVAGRYVEIDLIVPEYIKDNETWQKLAWFSHYDPTKLGDKVTVFATGPESYTLIFAATK